MTESQLEKELREIFEAYDVDMSAGLWNEALADRDPWKNLRTRLLKFIQERTEKAIEPSLNALGCLEVQGFREVVPNWVCVPEVEWDSIFAMYLKDKENAPS